MITTGTTIKIVDNSGGASHKLYVYYKNGQKVLQD